MLFRSRSALRSGTSVRLLEVLVGGAAFDATTILRSMAVFALPAYAGTNVGRKLAVMYQGEREFEPVLFDSADAVTSVAEPAAEAVAPVSLTQTTGAASWDPLDAAVLTAAAISSPEAHSPAGPGLCPRCGAVNNPRNAACIMCETALQ